MVPGADRSGADVKPDGGAAFPGTIDKRALEQPATGMSLRDYFAAAALPSLMRPESATEAMKHGNPALFFAQGAYEIADAMLVEREKP